MGLPSSLLCLLAFIGPSLPPSLPPLPFSLSFSRFYTLLVVSTALFNQPPYKNLIVNGLVLARSALVFAYRYNYL